MTEISATPVPAWRDSRDPGFSDGRVTKNSMTDKDPTRKQDRRESKPCPRQA
jgi:hypothetical protein